MDSSIGLALDLDTLVAVSGASTISITTANVPTSTALTRLVKIYRIPQGTSDEIRLAFDQTYSARP